MKLVHLLLLSCVSLYSICSFADDVKEESGKEISPSYQEVIDEYKKYVEHTPAEVRQEVEKYRIKIAEINKSKKELYKKLSQEAQGYLKTEQKLKKKLPAKLRKEIKKTDIIEQEQKDQTQKK
jgi:hypothetical protein